MENPDTASQGGLDSNGMQKEVPRLSPVISPEEERDIERAISASLEGYEHRNVLLPGVEAQTAMADEDKDPTRNDALQNIPETDIPEVFKQPALFRPAPNRDGLAPSASPTFPHKDDEGVGLGTPDAVQHDSFQPIPSPVSINARIKNLQTKLAQEIFLLNDADADTLVYIDAAPQQPEQDDQEYKEYKNRCLKPHRVHSKKFLTLGSSYFENAFGPTKQHRILRRRGLKNNLPPGIKYVLDLTPPTEGDDAAYLMTELSCSMGVRMWFQAETHWDVSKTLVGGFDEFEYNSHAIDGNVPATLPTRKPCEASKDEKPSPKVPEKKPRHKMNWNGELPKPPAISEPETEQRPLEPLPTSPKPWQPTPCTGLQTSVSPRKRSNSAIPIDYTPVRHRSAIERVLHAISGMDPKLDSAPKIWTFVAVAKYFDCATDASIGDWVVRWMYAPPNSFFIELHPDIACQIAGAVRCATLYRDAYAILVGEEILDNLRRTRDKSYKARNTNSYGRVKEELTEEDQTRVEYGSKNFLERMYNTFSSLVDEHMIWLLDLREFHLVRDFHSESSHHMGIRQKLLQALKEWVRGRLLWVFCRCYDNSLFHLKESSTDGYPNPSYMTVYNTLSLQERIFTRTAWTLLNREDFGAGASNFWTDYGALNQPRLGWSKAAIQAKEEYQVQEVRLSVLERFAADFELAQLKEQSLHKPSANQTVTATAALQSTLTIALKAAQSTFLRATYQAETHSSIAESSGTVEHEATKNGTSILPDRTRKETDDTSGLSSFEELSVRSPPRRTEDGTTIKPRDKRRKLSETEELSIDWWSLDGKSSQEDDEKTLSNEEEAEDGQKTPRAEEHGLQEPNSHPSFQSADADGYDQNGLPVFVIPGSQGTVGDLTNGRNPIQGQSTLDHGLNTLNQRLNSLNEERNNLNEGRNNLQQAQYGMRPPPPLLDQPAFFRPNGTNPNGREFFAPTFSLQWFFKNVNGYIQAFSSKMLNPANHDLGHDALSLRLTDTLVCLDDNEWKYLPLWAGGCDDGSGGVFDDLVPSVEAGGFSAPGPEVHNGSAASSENSFDMVETSTISGSRNTSTVVQDGFSDTLDRNRVYEADSLWDEVLANKQAKANVEGDALDKGKGKASHLDENEDAQTMIPASIEDASVAKFDPMEDQWEDEEEGGFGSDLDEGGEEELDEEEDDPFVDANEDVASQDANVEDASDEDSDIVMI